MNVSSVNPSGRPTSRPHARRRSDRCPYTGGRLVSLDPRCDRGAAMGAARSEPSEVRRTFTCSGGGAGAAVMNSGADDSGHGVGASTPPASGTIRTRQTRRRERQLTPAASTGASESSAGKPETARATRGFEHPSKPRCAGALFPVLCASGRSPIKTPGAGCGSGGISGGCRPPRRSPPEQACQRWRRRTTGRPSFPRTRGRRRSR